MALFRIGVANDAANFIRGDGVYLRPGEMRDHAEWAALREASRAFLTPWEPIWPADDLTRAAFRRRLKRHAEEIERDEAYPFLIFREADDILLGGLTLGQVRRGVAQASTLGYWMGEVLFRQRLYVARGAGHRRLRLRHLAAAPDRSGLPAA